MLLCKPFNNIIVIAMLFVCAWEPKIIYGASPEGEIPASIATEFPYGDNPKAALMEVVTILLNGDKAEDVKKHTDEFYKILGVKNLIIDRKNFLDRELVNIFLVHHIEYGESEEKASHHDSEDVNDYRYSWFSWGTAKAKHENADVAKKLTQIEDLFKSRDATGLMEELSREFRTLKESLTKKDRKEIEVHLVSQHLEIFIDLMLIAAVKGRIRDFVPQYDLIILFAILEEEHIERDASHDWMKKYRLMKKYFKSQMSAGKTMQNINACMERDDIKLQNPPLNLDEKPIKPVKKMDRWAVLEKEPKDDQDDSDRDRQPEDDDDANDEDEDDDDSQIYVENWCNSFPATAILVHWDARRETEKADVIGPHNLIISTILSSIGHAHNNPTIIKKHPQWYSEMYVLDAMARHSIHMNDLNKYTLKQPEYMEARARLEKLLIDDDNADIDELKRFTLKVARLYAVVTPSADQATLDHVATEFMTLIDEIIRRNASSYINDVTQQMLHLIEVAVKKSAKYQPAKIYALHSDQFASTYDMVQDIYKKIPEIGAKGIWKELAAELYSNYGAERTPKIKYFYLLAINENDPRYSHIHSKYISENYSASKKVINGILGQHAVFKETELLDQNPELKLMTGRTSTRLKLQLRSLKDRQPSSGKYTKDMKLVLITLINIQEMVAKKLTVGDANLHKELELLNKAIVKRKQDSLSLNHQNLILNISELITGPTDFLDFPQLKEYFHDAKILNRIRSKIEMDLKTKGFDLLFALAARDIFTYNNSFEEYLEHIHYFYLLASEYTLKKSEEKFGELTSVDIEIAHHAIIGHFKLGDNSDPKSVKIPKTVSSLIHSEEIKDFLSKRNSEELASSIKTDKYTKYTYNSLTPRTLDYITYNVAVGIALLAIQDSYGRTGPAHHHRAFAGDFHEAATLLQKALKEAKNKFVFVRPTLQFGLAEVKKTMFSHLTSEQQSEMDPLLKDAVRRSEFMQTIYDGRRDKKEWIEIIQQTIDDLKKHGPNNVHSIEAFFLATSGFIDAGKRDSDKTDLWVDASIMEKTLEPMGQETDEWVWIRLSDPEYFPNFDTFGSAFKYLENTDQIALRIARFHADFQPKMLAINESNNIQLCNEWFYFLSEIIVRIKFYTGTGSFFNKHRNCQWALAFFDFKLSEHFKELDYLNASVHRSVLTHNLKMPNVFKHSTRQHPVGKDSDEGSKKKKDDDGNVFAPFTQHELNNFKDDLYARATKNAGHLSRLAVTFKEWETTSALLVDDHMTFGAYLPFQSDKTILKEIRRIAEDAKLLDESIRAIIGGHMPIEVPV